MYASELLLKAVDSICGVSPQARVIVMGDFNDPPDSPPLRHLSGKGLINVSGEGNYNYMGDWECLDHFLVSASERDKTHLGYKPKRTYRGPVYHGGVSDHLPVTLKFITFVSYGFTTR